MKKVFLFVAIVVCVLSMGADEGGPDAGAVYERMRAELNKVGAYTSTWEEYSSRGKKHEMFTRRIMRGRLMKSPKHYCRTITKAETSFDEQCKEGFQECYTASDNLSKMVLPGAYRVVGEIPIFPEDPKAYYINGENLATSGVWDFFDNWDRMLEGGRLEVEESKRGGKSCWLLTIYRGSLPDPDYNLDTAKIWVDKKTWFPKRIEYLRPGESKAAAFLDFREINLNPGLTAEDMGFEGLTLKWNLAKPPGGEGLDKLKLADYQTSGDASAGAGELLQKMDLALASIKDYAVTMTTSHRLYRVRLLKTERFNYIKGAGFGLELYEVAANYILFLPAKGSRMYHVPRLSPLVHVVPSGVYRVVGEQTFSPTDPRLFTSMGDDVKDLNFFGIRDTINKRMKTSDVEAARVKSPAGTMIRLESRVPVGPREPKVMIVVIDDNTSLPLRVDYRGYEDKDGFFQVDFAGLKTNLGLAPDGLIGDIK